MSEDRFTGMRPLRLFDRRPNEDLETPLFLGDQGMWLYWKHKDEPICYNCRHWKHVFPDSDGRSHGTCGRLGGENWRYDYISMRDDSKLTLHTRCDFGCNLFSRKPPTTGRIEPEIEDEA